MAGGSSIAANAAFNGMFGGIILLCFEFLRVRQVNIYCPKSQQPTLLGHRVRVPIPSNEMFGWISQVNALNDKQILAAAGMDGYVFLRFLKLCSKLFTLCSLGSCVLVPIYMTAAGNPNVSGIDRLSLANVEAQGIRLWAPFVFLYIFVLLFLVMFHQEYGHFAALRCQYLTLPPRRWNELFSYSPPMQVAYSVMVENIPKVYRSSMALHQLFEQLFPGEVMFAHVSIREEALETAVNERNLLVRRIEEEIAKTAAHGDASNFKGMRPQIRLMNGQPVSSFRYWCYGGRFSATAITQIDSISYLHDQLSIACERVRRLQVKALAAVGEKEDASGQYTGSAHYYQNNERDNLGLSVVDGDPAAPSGCSSSQRIADRSASLIRKASSKVASASGNVASRTIELAGHTAGGIKTALVDVHATVVDLMKDRLASGTGFVTFRSRRAQMAAHTAPILCGRYPSLLVQPAPEPSDLVWENIAVSPAHTHSVARLTSAMYYTGLVFWMLILAFVSALSNLSTLEEYVPFLSHLNDAAYAILQGLVPVLVMMAFSALIPWVMNYISACIERRKIGSDVQREVFKWYYMYQMVNVYLLLLAGSVFDALSEALKDPSSVFMLLGASLPTVAVLYINFMLTSCLSGIPLILLQPVSAVKPMLYLMWFGRPERLTRNRMLEGPFAQQEIDYGTTLPDALFAVSIVLQYWAIAPLLVPFSAVYFWSLYLAYKYQLFFVVQPTFDRNGMFWYDLYFYSMAALLAATMLNIAYMAVKESVLQAPLLLPLPVMIILFWRHTEKEFRALSMHTPYDAVVAVDVDKGVGSMDGGNGDISQHSTFINPIVESKGCCTTLHPIRKYPEAASSEPVHTDFASAFNAQLFMQPSLVSPARVYPYPHRISGLPLLVPPSPTSCWSLSLRLGLGKLHDVYLSDITTQENPDQAPV